MSDKIGMSELVSAAMDMNKVMGLEPAIGAGNKLEKMDQAKLEAEIREQSTEVRSSDNFKASTWRLLESLGCIEEVIAERKKASKVKVDDPEEKDEEDSPDQDEGEEKDEEEDEDEEDEDTDEDPDEIKETKPPAKKGKTDVKKEVKKEVKKVTPPPAKKASPVKKEKGEKKPGIIATIEGLLRKKPMTRETLLAELQKKFDNDPKSMMSTIKTQVPTRLTKTKGLKFVCDDKGRYSIK